MIVLGIDPSVASTGVAIIQEAEGGRSILYANVIKTHPDEREIQRLDAIYDEIRDIIKEFKPEVAAFEDQFVGPSPQTSLYLARARSVAMLSAYHAGCDVVTYSPSEIKKCVTGKGNAKKEQVQEEIVRLYQDEPLVHQLFSGGIRKSGKHKNDDISDALAVAHTHLVLCT